MDATQSTNKSTPTNKPKLTNTSAPTNRIIYRVLIYLSAAVWFINGLVYKVLNLVPRHEKIVARILGEDYARTLTMLIGISEILMAVWILSGIQRRLNAATQIALVAVMNTLEFILAPDLLLWGRFNLLFALLFIFIIFYNEFMLNKNIDV
jgi:hypothetical protein